MKFLRAGIVLLTAVTLVGCAPEVIVNKVDEKEANQIIELLADAGNHRPKRRGRHGPRSLLHYRGQQPKTHRRHQGSKPT